MCSPPNTSVDITPTMSGLSTLLNDFANTTLLHASTSHIPRTTYFTSVTTSIHEATEVNSVSTEADYEAFSGTSFLTMATICTNVSCRAATIHYNETSRMVVSMNGKDASWILTSAVIIFTMQTGFGLLESGAVSSKNEVNIMVKNALDVVFGGITYWAFGFGLSFGEAYGTNEFVGIGCFFFDADDENMGYSYALFLFQLSFSTTATTIVSGAMAERTKLSAYIIFSLINTVMYSLPAHWVWAESGFLYKMGCIDIAGCGPVHLIGGATGLMATLMLKPRMGKFGEGYRKEPLHAPLKAILGMFMLWWGWLRFNSGSVFIISDSSEWRLAVRAAVNTMVSSMGGGITAVIFSLIYSRIRNTVRYDVSAMINGVLGSLVSITSLCTLCRPWEAIVIGCVGALLASLTELLIFHLKIDDPVGVIPVHGTCSIWGLVTVGLFLDPQYSLIPGEGGLIKTGRGYMLGIQLVAVGSILAWSLITGYIILKVLDLTIGLRLSPDAEEVGADILDHGVQNSWTEQVFSMKSLEKMAEESDHIVEFKQRLHMLFMDIADSCDRHDIKLDVQNSARNVVSFHIGIIEKAPSLDSGVEIHTIT